MTCEDAHLHMHDYISGELAPEHCENLMDHMDECPDCKEYFRQTEYIRQTMRNYMQYKAPSELQNTISSLLTNA